jgi:hypothetical protein
MKTKLLFLFSFALTALSAQTIELDWGYTSSNQQISINVGQTVKWNWGTAGRHNIEHTSGPEVGFGVNDLQDPGYEYSHTFTSVGINTYICTPHSSMYGTITVTEATQSFSPGDIVITEFMNDSDAVSDTVGEWFEIYNATGSAIDLNGWIIKDDGSNSHTIITPIIVPATSYFVLGRTLDTSTNGGAAVDYEYGSSFTLSNAVDEIVLLSPDLVEIDRIVYGASNDFPDDGPGKSISLDPTLMTADNNVGSNWCLSTSTYGAGDFGTPGASNDTCSPVCEASLGSQDVACDAITSGVDTYSVTLDFSGAGTSNFEVTATAGTVGGDNPSTATDGSITVSGIAEGTDITITMDDTTTGGLCALTREVTSPVCEPTGSVELELVGVIDFTVPSAGSDGKAIHVVATANISDLSVYGIGIAGNGQGTDGQEYTFDAISVSAGDHILVARSPSAMESYFTTAGYNLFDHVLLSNTRIDSNGNDAAELFKNGSVVETFGEIVFVGGSGNFSMDWAFQDSWAYKNVLGSVWPNGWIYGGQQCTDNSTTTFDSTCVYPFIAEGLSNGEFASDELAIFPNPVNDGFVNIKTQVSSAVNIKLYDIMGRCILSKQINSETLDVRAIGSGVYILQVSVADRSSTTKLIIR